MANQVQKAIRGEYGDSVKLPKDAFEGFRPTVPDQEKVAQEALDRAARLTKLSERQKAWENRPDVRRAREANDREAARRTAPDLNHLRSEAAKPAVAPHPTGEPKLTIQGHINRIDDNIRESFRDYEDPEARHLGAHSLSPERVARGIEEAERHGDTHVTVKIPSFSEVSMLLEDAKALHAANSGVPRNSVGDFESKHPRVPAGSKDGGEFTSK